MTLRPIPVLLSALCLHAAPPDLAVPPADALRTPSGVAYRVIQAGKGDARPAPGGFVRVHFTGWGADGATFANTRALDEAPYLGLDRLMPGMREMLLAMMVGEQRRVWLPEAQAFGGAKGRPAGTVVMDLELLDAVPPPGQVPADVAAPPADAMVLRSGLAFKILRPGTGKAHPVPASWVSVHYTGWTTDGKMFDSSLTKGVSVPLQLKGTIPGWVEGLQLMVEGERRRFWIPEKLAYQGARGMPQGMLVFDVELVRINP
ncbi:MAG TPA: FKBP-type peptidyl-prolyl cis-trans isomerase [Geothrix sp.]|nr:FKBP-type peptidyl-prolyl cis-trans isomerase [Geothrix sp.]